MGFTNVTLGYDPGSSAINGTIKEILEEYMNNVRHLDGVTRESRGRTEAVHLDPNTVIAAHGQLQAIFRQLVEQLNGNR